MNELKKIFGEIGHAYTTAWSRKKHFTHIIGLLAGLAILPTVLFLIADILVGLNVIGIQTAPIALIIILLITFASIVFSALLAVGFVSKIRSIVAHKHEPLSKILKTGAQKFFPSIWLGILSVLPFIVAVAFTISFEIGVWGLLVIIPAAILIIVTNFAKLFLLIDDEKVYTSLMLSIPLVVKNFFALVLRALAVFVAILLPTIVVTGIISMIGIYIIQLSYGFADFSSTVQLIEAGLIPLGAYVLSVVFESISTIVAMFVVLPVMVIYANHIFELFKNSTKTSDKYTSRLSSIARVSYAVTAVLSIAVFINTIF